MSGLEGILVCEEDVRELRALLDQRAGRDGADYDRLEEELDRATVVPRSALPADVVGLRSAVEFEDERTRRRQLVELVLPPRADPGRGRISVVAPVGAALLGLRVGQSLDWPVPRGSLRVRILRVVQQAPVAPPTLG